MNINEYKKYLQNVHGTLDDDPGTKQISSRISRTYRETAHDMDEYKPDKKEDKSTVAPTTAAGDTLRPGSKSAEKMEKIKEELALQYFKDYFGGELNEDTSDEDILEAVSDLIELRDAVCEAVGLDEAKVVGFTKNKPNQWPSRGDVQATYKKGDAYPKNPKHHNAWASVNPTQGAKDMKTALDSGEVLKGMKSTIGTIGHDKARPTGTNQPA